MARIKNRDCPHSNQSHTKLEKTESPIEKLNRIFFLLYYESIILRFLKITNFRDYKKIAKLKITNLTIFAKYIPFSAFFAKSHNLSPARHARPTSRNQAVFAKVSNTVNFIHTFTIS